MQTPRDISYTGNPTGGTTAYPAVLPAAHEATENSDNIFYRTIRTVMKKQLNYQDTAAAPDGKYNIVVSCSTSAYGDYMDACTTNVMYVDDFEWVY